MPQSPQRKAAESSGSGEAAAVGEVVSTAVVTSSPVVAAASNCPSGFISCGRDSRRAVGVLAAREIRSGRKLPLRSWRLKLQLGLRVAVVLHYHRLSPPSAAAAKAPAAERPSEELSVPSAAIAADRAAGDYHRCGYSLYTEAVICPSASPAARWLYHQLQKLQRQQRALRGRVTNSYL